MTINNSTPFLHLPWDTNTQRRWDTMREVKENQLNSHEQHIKCEWKEKLCGWELTTGSIIKLHEESCIKSWKIKTRRGKEGSKYIFIIYTTCEYKKMRMRIDVAYGNTWFDKSSRNYTLLSSLLYSFIHISRE